MYVLFSLNLDLFHTLTIQNKHAHIMTQAIKLCNAEESNEYVKKNENKADLIIFYLNVFLKKKHAASPLLTCST